MNNIELFLDQLMAKDTTAIYAIRKFVGVIEIPDDRANYTADTRKGIAVEYVTKGA